MRRFWIIIVLMSMAGVTGCAPVGNFAGSVAREAARFLVWQQRSAGEFETVSALGYASLMIDLQPDNPLLYINRGQLYLNLYEWDESLEDFNTAIALAPDYADAYFHRGVLYYSVLQTGQALREDALADFRHYLALAPDGEYAAQARDYAGRIEAELAALNE